ncbi:MAG: phosphatase PAP2 family protein [Ignavibacteriaceae bacterium]|nr:phosphatase PAP2 family protein [Ignavibacteriaceae bacterium]
MSLFKSFIHKLKAFDLVVVVFYIILTLLHLIFPDRIKYTGTWLAINAGVIFFAFLISYLEASFKGKIWRIIHYWYIAPLILLTFKQLYYLVKPIRQIDYDYLFIEIDRWMFGTDPTHFLFQFSHPVLTEILQIVYGSFYLLPIILGLVLLRRDRFIATDFAVFSIIYGFFVSYLGYFSLPGIGPRFTLHDFYSVNEQLPGLFLTNFLRDIVNTGESIPPGTQNAAELVQRDVFPSGHTMITLIVMYLSYRLRSRSKYFFFIVGSLLIFSTVYLWYHYVIDLIAGFIGMIFSMWSGKKIFNWWQRKLGLEEFQYQKH